MCIIAFIADASTLRDLSSPTSVSRRHHPASRTPRGPPMWEAAGAEWVDPRPPAVPSAQPEPAYEFDQRIAW
jgi:hypothetical protein